MRTKPVRFLTISHHAQYAWFYTPRKILKVDLPAQPKNDDKYIETREWFSHLACKFRRCTKPIQINKVISWQIIEKVFDLIDCSFEYVKGPDSIIPLHLKELHLCRRCQ